ncbi:hypothetical protein RhiirA4_465300 [Rhizophagus irregularis]|uniref:Uncharacterized protein n=1 Tax=Rhizophagus irregularis TaxID=588596 RepID=A0A2I1GRS7_9GLOM|nr:hypothetical protein RhiirA4_465300 [Rhizophagus irregularis]
MKDFINTESVTHNVTSSQQIKSVEDQPIDIEISENPIHQSANVVQPDEELIISLNAKATPFTSKGKNRRVSYAKIVKQDSNSDSSRLNSPTSIKDKKRKIVQVSKTSTTSKSHPTTTKKQLATPASKTISTVMTGYNPTIKDNVQEITVYDIPSRWTQFDMLNHLKAWDQVIVIKFKLQQKYTTLTVSVNLNEVALNLWNNGA